MGKTVPSYRMALEMEIKSWAPFIRWLSKEDLQAFSALMDMCRSFAMAGGNATRPVIFEPMVMSILLFRQKKINELEKRLNQEKARRRVK